MSEQLESASSSKTKIVKVLPTITLDMTDMPEVADYDVGECYDAVIHCKMVSKREGTEYPFGDEDDKLKNLISGRFQILSIKPLDSKPNGDKLKALKTKAESY